MGQLPFSRIESHGPQTPIKGNTVDAIQDAIIGKKAPLTPLIYGPNGGGVAPVSPANWAATIAASATSNYFASTGAVAALIYLPSETGDRAESIHVRVFGDGAADCTYTFGYLDSSGVLQPLFTGTDTNRSAAWATLDLASLGAFTARTLLPLEMYACHISINATGYRIQKWTVNRSRP